jgi:glycosyltransferase involved in cell wall biosynthesis
LTTTASDASRERLEHNHRAFTAAIGRARDHFDEGHLLEAAVHAGVASNLATWMHPSLCASGDLERLSVQIGRAAAGEPSDVRPRPRDGRVGHVLHVFSRTLTVGGHTRMVWRWMSLDGTRRHSVAVTRQGGRPVPSELVAASEATGGRVSVLSRKRGTVLSWARELHELATRADVVVLHVDPEDIVPVIAFANRSDLPPILYLNHADHLFWLGVGIADLVVNLRYSGHDLSPKRRGVPPERNAFIPIALGERVRTMSRSEAKERLGLPSDTVLLVTIARAVKFEYRSDTGESYVDAVLPVVNEFDNVRLILVGPSQEGDFQRAHDESGGRITALGERTDNDVLLQAADVFIDSYPQMSPTSLLEAGSYGVSLIALNPDVDVSPILYADAPGIDAGLVRARSVDEFRQSLKELIVDPDRRVELGERTRVDIERLHLGANWTRQLEELYQRAVSTPALLDVPAIGDTPHFGPPDTTIAMASPPRVDADDLLLYHLRLLPPRARVQAWLRAARGGKRPSPGLLLSESNVARLQRYRHRRASD